MGRTFTGRTVLITGGTTGIGRAMAQRFAEGGAHMLVNSEDAEACDRTVSELTGQGLQATAMPCDVSDTAKLGAMTDAALAVTGQIDVLLCNAGIAGDKRSGDEGFEAQVSQVFAINLHHARILCDRLLPRMAEAGGGSAVLTSSLSGLRGNRNIGVYSLTKAALAQLARDMAVRHGPGKVRVNAISPGLIATGWEKTILASPQAAERRMQMTPLRRVGSPEEVAAAAYFLASDEASFITGHNLIVDGGTVITDGN